MMARCRLCSCLRRPRKKEAKESGVLSRKPQQEKGRQRTQFNSCAANRNEQKANRKGTQLDTGRGRPPQRRGRAVDAGGERARARPLGPSPDHDTAAGTSARAASGSRKALATTSLSSVRISGYRSPGSTWTAKTSCTPDSNRRNATVCPVRVSTTQTPQARSSTFSRSVIGMPLNRALSRTCDRPTNANGPKKSSPRVKPGKSATGSNRPLAGSTTARLPAPDSSTQRRPSYHRGECGMLSPRAMISPDGTSIRIPPRALLARHPAESSVAPRAVTYRGRPSRKPSPLRWQRSSGARAVTNGGRQRGTKLYRGSSVHKQLNRVLTAHSSGVRGQESGVS